MYSVFAQKFELSFSVFSIQVYKTIFYIFQSVSHPTVSQIVSLPVVYKQTEMADTLLSQKWRALLP